MILVAQQCRERRSCRLLRFGLFTYLAPDAAIRNLGIGTLQWYAPTGMLTLWGPDPEFRRCRS